jgi:hypothetical protein
LAKTNGVLSDKAASADKDGYGAIGVRTPAGTPRYIRVNL